MAEYIPVLLLLAAFGLIVYLMFKGGSL